MDLFTETPQSEMKVPSNPTVIFKHQLEKQDRLANSSYLAHLMRYGR